MMKTLKRQPTGAIHFVLKLQTDAIAKPEAELLYLDLMNKTIKRVLRKQE